MKPKSPLPWHDVTDPQIKKYRALYDAKCDYVAGRLFKDDAAFILGLIEFAEWVWCAGRCEEPDYGTLHARAGIALGMEDGRAR